MRKKSQAVVAESEDLGGTFGFWMVHELDRFALAKVIAATVGAELTNFFIEFCEAPPTNQIIESVTEIV